VSMCMWMCRDLDDDKMNIYVRRWKKETETDVEDETKVSKIKKAFRSEG